jgi:hypothetical protein
MQTAAYLYPWDVVGDPAAPDLVAGLGLDHVVLAAVYHATRAVTPRHPHHRVVTAPHTAAYYTLDPHRWHGKQLRPSPGLWTGEADPFERASAALDAARVRVHAWVVLNHVDLPAPVPHTVVNAYGDRYPWALCPAQDAVLEYATGVAADVAGLPGIGAVELEAAGWFGADHAGAHDKTGAAALSSAERYLLSLCFCDACGSAYARAGVEPDPLRRKVRASLMPAFAGHVRGLAADTDTASELAEIDTLLGVDLAAAVASVRQQIAEGYRSVVVAAVRQRRADLPVLLHVNPRPHRSAAFTGVNAARAARSVDALVVNCWFGVDNLLSTVDAGAPVHASLLAVSGLGGSPADLGGRVESIRAAGAAGIRLYHAGMATDADLAAIRSLSAEHRSTP